MSLQDGFAIEKASSEDMPEIWKVLEDAFTEDKVWELVIRNCKKEEVLPWTIATLGPRWVLPDIETYKVVEKSSGKIVGYTSLQFPWKDRPAMSDESKSLALSEELPPMLDGMNKDALVELFTILGYTAALGYDPEKDYHRKGTMIHPDYQRRGFGRQLTRHCNAIADQAGVKTWVPARQKSVNMFKTEGFTEIAIRYSDMEKYGGISGDPTWYLLREPPS